MSDWLIQRFETYADRPFLAHQDSVTTYGQLKTTIDRYAKQFHSQGVRPGDVITLQGDYSLNGIAALFAIFKLKAVAAPIVVASEDEAQMRRDAAGARWHIDAAAEPRLSSLETTAPPHALIAQLAKGKHPGLILFSSGSTGTPKAMIHNVDNLLGPLAKKRARKLHILIFLLFDHIGGLNTLFNGLAGGALMVVPPSRDADIVAETIERHSVNLLPASPTFLNLLLISGATARHDLSSLRFITYGTETMPESLLRRIKDALPNVALIQTFGTSETGITQTTSRSSGSTLLKFDDPNTEYKIVEGELWLRSKSQILGYLNHDMARFTPDGWFKTNDLVETEADGYLRIIGRREDVINVGGEKVTPSEVESVLLELPEVLDCTVYGEKNAITGQNVAAEIVPDSAQDPRELKRKIKSYCREKLSAYKIPARIKFTDATTYGARYKKKRAHD